MTTCCGELLANGLLQGHAGSCLGGFAFLVLSPELMAQVLAVRERVQELHERLHDLPTAPQAVGEISNLNHLPGTAPGDGSADKPAKHAPWTMQPVTQQRVQPATQHGGLWPARTSDRSITVMSQWDCRSEFCLLTRLLHMFMKNASYTSEQEIAGDHNAEKVDHVGWDLDLTLAGHLRFRAYTLRHLTGKLERCRMHEMVPR